MYTFMILCVLTGLDYYIFMYIKLKSTLNIRYDVTLSTDICDIIVLTQNKSLYRSFYVWIYWNQVNQLWENITDYWNFKNNCSVIG